MIFKAPDDFTYDWRHALLSKREPTARKDIAVLLIDDNSLANHPYVTPVNPQLLSNLILALDSFNASAIGIDIVLDRGSASEAELFDAVRKIKSKLVFIEMDKRSDMPQIIIDRHHQILNKLKTANPSITTGHPYLDQTRRGLSIPDQTIRLRAPTLSDAEHVKASFSEALLSASGHKAPEFNDRGHISWLKSVAEDGSSVFSDLRVPLHEIDALRQKLLPESWKAAISGKIVIVGTALRQRDGLLTPLSLISGERMPEAWVHANIAAQFIDGRKLAPFGANLEWFIVVLCIFVGFWAGRVYRAKDYEVYVYFTGALTLIIIGILLFSEFRLLIPSDTIFFGSLIGISLGHYSGWLQPVLKEQEGEQRDMRAQADAL